MSVSGFVNVTLWDVDQVSSWIKGLEDECAKFSEVFREAGIDGKRLLTLDYASLAAMNIRKFGWQECLLRSIQQLVALNVEIEDETLATIALRLDCEARNLSNLLRSMSLKGSHDIKTSRTVAVEILLGVSDISETIKYMCPWLDRVPFDRCDVFSDLKNKFIDHALQLIVLSKTEDAEEIQQICDSINSLCDEIIINSKDPLVIQKSSLELVTLHRESEEALGISIVSSCDNAHVIGHIKENSVADRSRKIDIGDEIIQLNYQTVIGWKLTHLLSIFGDHKKDVTLTLKKKPHHLTQSGGYQKKKSPKKQLPPSGFPTEFNRGTANAKANSRRRIKEIHSTTDDSIPEQDTDGNVSDSEVFNSRTDFIEPNNNNNNNDDKVRRVTVSGTSPTLQRRVVGSTENIVSLRPKSYFPVSTNIPILSGELKRPNFELKKFQEPEKNEPNNAVPLSNPDRPPVDSPPVETGSVSSRKGSSESEVAGGTESVSSPRLVRWVKVDSTKRSELTQKKRNESISSLDSVVSSSSYSSQGSNPSNLKQQKVHFRSERDLTSPLYSGLLRKNILRRTGLNRRISCKDLGRGDCQGWLWKKKKEGTGLVSSRWSKCWFVLKNKDLYYYNSTEDEKALGVIHLPGFIVSPTNESRSKKYAFKAYNRSGVVFFFASDRQDDMAKWMNKIGLSSLENLDTNHLTTTAGFVKPGREELHLPDFSESDDDGTDGAVSLKDSGSVSSVRGNPEDLFGLYQNICAANLDLSGTDVKARRSTILRASTIDRGSARKNEAVCNLLSLKRTLKDKEQIILILNEFLNKSPITPIDLIHFKVMHPSIIKDIDNNDPAGRNETGDEDISSVHGDLDASDSCA